MERMDVAGIVRMLDTIAAAMVKHKSTLIELDSAIGDGDLGLTMERGFEAARKIAHSSTGTEPGALLMKAGMEIAKEAPSTMGTLMGTGFMRGGKAVSSKPELTASDFTGFFAAFLQGVADRGKAHPGEKTILDVLLPAVERMKAYTGNDIREVLLAAHEGAASGLEAEMSMMSQHGKAAVFREKTIGMKDPGSIAVAVMIEACLASVA